MPLADLFLPYIWGEGASRAFAEWQRETTLPESDLKSKGWARVKVGLRVLSVSRTAWFSVLATFCLYRDHGLLLALLKLKHWAPRTYR